MEISKSELLEFLCSPESVLTLNQYIEFEFHEERREVGEECTYLISMNKNDTKTVIEALIYLLERGKYAEYDEYWYKNAELIINQRNSSLWKDLYESIKEGSFVEYGKVETLRQLHTYVDVNFMNVIEDRVNQSEKIYFIFQEWNLLQMMGETHDKYYLICWFTTA